jgi:hypothetical protein
MLRALSITLALAFLSLAARAAEVQLHWLEGQTPTITNGVTWGVPWPEGTLKKDQPLYLLTSGGDPVSMQTWPLATWPDGSVKWTAQAIPPTTGLSGTLTLGTDAPIPAHPGTSVVSPQPLTAKEDAQTITVDSGQVQWVIAKSGTTIIQSITRDGKLSAENGRLVCLTRSQPDMETAATVTQQSFTGDIDKVTLEQSGPIRAVIKIEGKHASASRKWLPFILRLYFYAGGDSVRIVHTIIYDGDMNTDFIAGLGFRFDVPIEGELYDRHVRFGGEEGGVWGEAVQGLTGLRRDPGDEARNAQVDGQLVPAPDTWSPNVANNIQYIPAFGDYSLFQSSADSYSIRKRTREGFTWLNSATGHRAPGLGYIGSPTGGVAFGIRNFWQSFPSQLDIRGAAGKEAEVTMWLWSPDANPMDMRFYHDDMGEDTYQKQTDGLNITYEDYEPSFATPDGVARTSEMTITALHGTPSRDDTAKLAAILQTPPQIVARPQDYKAAQIFGGAIWGLPDRSTPLKAHIEDQLDFYFDFYKKEVDQRSWYGYWYFGNVMHAYDADRHVWRYDVGGFAWDNSELSTDLWLWYDFLRSGRADIFRFAEAMCRYSGEVDVYHSGRFAGLGTRHGVIPWGDSAKQLRISTAENRRFYYYLTADERTGDLLWEEVNADQRLATIEPGRKLNPPQIIPKGAPFPEIMSVGTDWGSVGAALITAWERTGDTKYRDKLITSMKSIAALSHGWFSGEGGYDPATGTFYPFNNKIDVEHLSVVFGGFEVNAELLQLIDVPEYAKTWIQYCQLYNAPPDEQKAALGEALGEGGAPGRGRGKLNLGQGHSRLTAYAAYKLNDPKLAARAWQEFLGGAAGLKLMPEPFQTVRIDGPLVLKPTNEVPGLSTNAVNQWALPAIQVMALAGDHVPSGN